MAIGAGVLVPGTAALEAEESLHLAHDPAAGGLGLEDLPKETLEGQPEAVDTVAAVEPPFLGGEELRGEDALEVVLQFSQGGLADGSGEAPAAGGEPGVDLREERRMRRAVYVPTY